jgi:hypothetical protein
MLYISFEHFKSANLSSIGILAFISLVCSCYADSIKPSDYLFFTHSSKSNEMQNKINEFKRSLSLSVQATPPYVICSRNFCQDGIFKWHKSKTRSLHIGGIFPMIGGWPGGQSCLPSAIIALNEINLNPTILPGYRLSLNWFNSEVGTLWIISYILLSILKSPLLSNDSVSPV